MLGMQTKNNKDFHSFTEIVKQYVTTGAIPAGSTKETLLNQLSALSESEKKSLIDAIKFELPLTSWAFTGPLFENIPNAAKWAVLAGIAGGVAEHQTFRDLPSAIAIGVTTSIVTFFGQQAYKSQQVNLMWKAREKRADEFLQPLRASLSLPVTIDQSGLDHAMRSIRNNSRAS